MTVDELATNATCRTPLKHLAGDKQSLYTCGHCLEQAFLDGERAHATDDFVFTLFSTKKATKGCGNVLSTNLMIVLGNVVRGYLH